MKKISELEAEIKTLKNNKPSNNTINNINNGVINNIYIAPPGKEDITFTNKEIIRKWS